MLKWTKQRRKLSQASKHDKNAADKKPEPCTGQSAEVAPTNNLECRNITSQHIGQSAEVASTSNLECRNQTSQHTGQSGKAASTNNLECRNQTSQHIGQSVEAASTSNLECRNQISQHIGQSAEAASTSNLECRNQISQHTDQSAEAAPTNNLDCRNQTSQHIGLSGEAASTSNLECLNQISQHIGLSGEGASTSNLEYLNQISQQKESNSLLDPRNTDEHPTAEKVTRCRVSLEGLEDGAGLSVSDKCNYPKQSFSSALVTVSSEEKTNKGDTTLPSQLTTSLDSAHLKPYTSSCAAKGVQPEAPHLPSSWQLDSSAACMASSTDNFETNSSELAVDSAASLQKCPHSALPDIARSVPSVEMEYLGPEVEWEQENLTMSQVADMDTFPCVGMYEESVRERNGQREFLSAGLKIYSLQPVLLHMKTRKKQARARTIHKDRKGAYYEVGQTLIIPDDYQGWFELVPSDFSRATCYLSIEEVAKALPGKFFTRSNIKGIRIEGEGDQQKYLERKIRAGSVLETKGTFTAKWKTRAETGLFKKKTTEWEFQEMTYLKCLDDDQEEVLIPVTHKGKFNAIYERGRLTQNAVYRMKDILADLSLPIKVRLLFGKAPVVPCIFTD